jgi:hypothetical protein
MEFLDSNLTKDSSILPHATVFTVPATGGFLKKPLVYSGFINLYKKETRKLALFMNSVERKNDGRKQDKNSRMRRLEFMSRNLD